MATAVQHQPSASRRNSAAGPSADRSRKRVSATSTSSGRSADAQVIGQWRIGRTIGKGSSGRVKIAKHSQTGQYAAVKIVPKGMIMSSRMSMTDVAGRSEKMLLGIEREIVIMKLIDHPNVLSLFDVWETSQELYLIMEYVPGGELFDYLVRRGRLPVSEALHYFQQIIFAVDYCHRFNICHRDLKPENLLLDKDKNIKVADFGMAAWQADERMLETSCGSPHYASPEIVAGKMYDGSASDIWSCGIILFALLTGRLPFDDDNIRTLLQKVKIGLFEMPDDIDPSARDLLRRMLEKDPVQRITMEKIKIHPFFTSRPVRLTNGRQLPVPPTLEAMARPVNLNEVDPDIMANLKTLWSGATHNDIVRELKSDEPTWEKAIFHLLVKYRSRHFENYNMDGESDDEDSDDGDRDRARPHSRPGRNPHNCLPSPPKQRRITPPITQQIRRKPAPLSENDTIQHHATPPPRPQAPTPKKAAAAAAALNVATGSPVTRAPSKLGPRGGHPAGPRSPVSRPTSGPPAMANNLPFAPAITLQEATPVKEIAAPQAKVAPGGVSPLRSPGPLSPLASPILPHADSPQVAPLSPPMVGDEKLQNFLCQIANQLNSMNIRSSTASSGSGHSTSLQSEFNAYMSYMSQQPPTPETTPNAVQVPLSSNDEDDQFADAADDNTEAMSICSYDHQSRYAPSPVPPSPISPSLPSPNPIGLGFGPTPRTHHTRSGPPPVSGRWSHGSGSYRPRSFSSRAESPVPGLSPALSPGLYSPNPSFTSYTESPPLATTPHPLPTPPSATIPLPAFPPTHLQAGRSAPPPPPKVASRRAPAPPGPRSGADRERVVSQLGRENSYVFVDTPDMIVDQKSSSSWGSKASAFGSHRGTDGFGMLRKRKKIASIDPSAVSPVSPSVNSPKRSWFNNLFSFKPESKDLLIKSTSISEARDKVRRVLSAQGVRVTTAEYDGLRGFRCKIADTRDIQGNVVKGVRFRVEFSRTVTAGTTFATNATLTLERGALSAFNAAYNRLQTSLDNEALAAVAAAAPEEKSHAPRQTFSLGRATATGSPRRPSLWETGLAPAPPRRGTISAPVTPIDIGRPMNFSHQTGAPIRF